VQDQPTPETAPGRRARKPAAVPPAEARPAEAIAGTPVELAAAPVTAAGTNEPGLAAMPAAETSPAAASPAAGEESTAAQPAAPKPRRARPRKDLADQNQSAADLFPPATADQAAAAGPSAPVETPAPPAQEIPSAAAADALPDTAEGRNGQPALPEAAPPERPKRQRRARDYDSGAASHPLEAGPETGGAGQPGNGSQPAPASSADDSFRPEEAAARDAS
jgi:hypothetical protein